MIEISIPGFKDLRLWHLVLDYNGTLAFDGLLIKGVASALNDLSKLVDIHVITADTFGMVRKELADVCCRVEIIAGKDQDTAKLNYIKKLGCQACVCIGNGRNDRRMLESAAIGIALILQEGGASETIMAADVVSRSISDALNLLLNPLRLTATLRS